MSKKKGLESTECPICKNTLKDAVITVCAHTFCERCLGEWQKTKATCPVCRSRIGKPKPNHAARDATKRLVEMHQDLHHLSTATAVGNVHHSLQTSYTRLCQQVRAFLP